MCLHSQRIKLKHAFAAITGLISCLLETMNEEYSNYKIGQNYLNTFKLSIIKERNALIYQYTSAFIINIE